MKYHFYYGKKINLNDFILEEDKYLDYESIKCFNYLVESVKENKGVYLSGDPLVGKTYLMHCFAKFCLQEGYTIGFINLPIFLYDLKPGKQLYEHFDCIMNDLKTYDILIIDDIGAEHFSLWNCDRFLLPLFNERILNHKNTYFTSNYSLENLCKYYILNSKFKNDMSITKYIDLIFKLIPNIKEHTLIQMK